MQSTIRPRRLFVSGGSRLSANAALLWTELGRLLAGEGGLVVVTGGLAGRADSSGVATADQTIVDGMIEGLRARGIPLDERIETVLPDRKKDWAKLARFREGTIRILEQRTPQSRRFSMVHSADVVIAIEGEHGTRSVLDMALAIERPTFPVPFGGGVAREIWHDQRAEICRWFRISPQEADAFDRCDLKKLTDAEIPGLACVVHKCLMRGFAQSCFVIMQFRGTRDPIYDDAIFPVLDMHGIEPWRTDRSVLTGNVVEAIRDGLRHCHFAIADTTGDRPNVMYELGMAHAAEKPVILLRQQASDGTIPTVPFDFQSESIIKYSDNLADLRRSLTAAIAMIPGVNRRTDESHVNASGAS
jgi:predicted Rossmann-fold nucleotide-binding protein